MKKDMKAIFTTGLLVLALIGCDRDGGERIVANAAAESDYQARLKAMPDGQRNAVFIRALRDSGQDCQGVESSAFQGETSGRPTWLARCRGGAEWLIMIGKDGSAQVVSAPEAIRRGLASPVENAH